MDKRTPNDPSSFNHKFALLSTGRTYHYVDEFDGDNFNPNQTTTLICLHGFPDFWYGWRNQISPWCNEGWRVIVPDMLGYGQTDKPEDPAAYTSKSLSDDMNALLDYVGVHKAVVIGHDWGSALAWRFAVWYPSRCEAVVNLALPYFPPKTVYLTLEEIVDLFPSFGYQLYFSDPQNTKEIEGNLETFMASMYQTPTSNYRDGTVLLTGKLQNALQDKTPKWDKSWNRNMNEDEVRYYLETFGKGGMTGPLNYYRTTKHRYDEEKAHNITAYLPNIPWILIYGSKDQTCNSKLVENTKKFAPQIKIEKLEGISHWVMIEAKREITEMVTEFIKNNVKTGKSRL